MDELHDYTYRHTATGREATLQGIVAPPPPEAVGWELWEVDGHPAVMGPPTRWEAAAETVAATAAEVIHQPGAITDPEHDYWQRVALGPWDPFDSDTWAVGGA